MPGKRRERAPSVGEQARAVEVVDRLDREMPDARIALEFQDDLQLLVSVILSAQSTDARVNIVSPALFERFPDAAAYAAAKPEELWPYIRTLGLFRAKARSIVGAMRAIAEEHGGRVPRERAALEALPGVGRKTAGVVLIHLGAGHAFPVDTHVGRVARRLGFTREAEPGRVEERLVRLLPQDRWARGHQLFVWHGRRTCTAVRPACERCALADLCPKIGVQAPERPRRAVRASTSPRPRAHRSSRRRA
jgi:endonuclease III